MRGGFDAVYLTSAEAKSVVKTKGAVNQERGLGLCGTVQLTGGIHAPTKRVRRRRENGAAKAERVGTGDAMVSTAREKFRLQIAERWPAELKHQTNKQTKTHTPLCEESRSNTKVEL